MARAATPPCVPWGIGPSGESLAGPKLLVGTFAHGPMQLVDIARRLTLLWGVSPVLSEDVVDVRGMTDLAVQTATRLGFAQPGQTIVIAAGLPFGTPGSTNLLRIAQVE